MRLPLFLLAIAALFCIIFPASTQQTEAEKKELAAALKVIAAYLKNPPSRPPPPPPSNETAPPIPGSIPPNIPQCNLTTDPNKCALSSLTGNITNVQGGEGTGCLNESFPFMFQVFKGSTDNLLIYFQGGGACWNNKPDGLGSCNAVGNKVTMTTRPYLVYGNEGVFNQSFPGNPYQNYTIISVSYCSGDAHAGNAVRNYTMGKNNATNGIKYQRGGNNTMSALNWALTNIPNPKRVVVMGCSAGSMGTQLWAPYIVKRYRETNPSVATAVIPDSYAGIFPPSQTSLITDFNLAPEIQALLTQEMRDKLANGTLWWCELVEYMHSITPDTPWLAIQSKADGTQRAFYTALAFSSKNINRCKNGPKCACASSPKVKLLSQKNFYKHTVGLFRGYVDNVAPAMFATYFANGVTHCFTPYDIFFNTTINVDGKEINMAEWAGQVPFSGADGTVGTQCASAKGAPKPFNDMKCDPKLDTELDAGNFIPANAAQSAISPATAAAATQPAVTAPAAATAPAS